MIVCPAARSNSIVQSVTALLGHTVSWDWKPRPQLAVIPYATVVAAAFAGPGTVSSTPAPRVIATSIRLIFIAGLPGKRRTSAQADGLWGLPQEASHRRSAQDSLPSFPMDLTWPSPVVSGEMFRFGGRARCWR